MTSQGFLGPSPRAQTVPHTQILMFESVSLMVHSFQHTQHGKHAMFE